ncbi:hypothetical protein L7F22_057807 [Adiantum nelumboides]|nr:hypothetical protein [Adiantum nelumboides]
MEELFQSQQQEEPVEMKRDDSNLESYQGSGDTAVAAVDPNKEETQVWLKRVDLRCVFNTKIGVKRLQTPVLFVRAKGKKVTDSQMKGEFGDPIGAKLYYMVRNAARIRAANLFWYLEKVCIIHKTAYILKEAFAPLYQAEQGGKVDWAMVLYDWIQLTGKRDRRRTPVVGRVAPYLAYIFEHVLKVTPTALGMKTPAADTLMEEGIVNVFSMGSELKKSESKGRKITLFLTWIAGFGGKNVLESSMAKEGGSASHLIMGIFSVEEATNCLNDLGKFLQSQDEALRVLQNAKQEHKCSVLFEGKMQQISLQLLQEKSEKEKLQEETVEDEQFKELDEKVAALTTENVMLINRLSPFSKMEKAVLQGQGMTGVLLANFDVNVLKKEVLEYAQDMWNRATKLWREHMALPTDQFKNWFLCAGQESVKRENEALKVENECLIEKMQEMRTNHKEIEDSLSKLKAEFSSGILESDRN